MAHESDWNRHYYNFLKAFWHIKYREAFKLSTAVEKYFGGGRFRGQQGGPQRLLKQEIKYLL